MIEVRTRRGRHTHSPNTLQTTMRGGELRVVPFSEIRAGDVVIGVDGAPVDLFDAMQAGKIAKLIPVVSVTQVPT